jgi:anti-sigma B factor antagonist
MTHALDSGSNDKSTPAADAPPRRQAGAGLDVQTTDLAQGVVVRLDGKADMLTVDRMQFALGRLLARRVPLAVLDLSGLVFLASLAIAVLVTFRRDLLRRGGRVRLAGIRPEIHECFQVAGLADLFEFCPTVEEALTAVD